MLKRKHYLALGAVTLVTALVLSLPSRAVSHLKLGIGGLFLPLFGAVNAARQLPDRAAYALLPRSELLKEIETLQNENQQLKVQNSQAAATARENDQLRALVGWQRQQPWKLKLASVVLRDPANWWRTIQIDLGKRDGLVENLPGADLRRPGWPRFIRRLHAFAGRFDWRSEMSRVRARRQSGARLGRHQPRRAAGKFTRGSGLLSGNANLKSGQEVVTSGEGGIFPAGIPIGLIAENARPVESGISAETRVKLSANLGALDQVWVLFQ